MSSIDQRIVQMQFDNAKFEQGAKTTMSTLDKLKSALNFDKSAKSLQSLQSTSSKINFSGLSSAVETIAGRFTNLGIIGVTALQNVTNAAISTGTQMVKSLTLDPILSGFNEYETKMGSITTILTNTQSKGTTLDDVNRALDELNTYADQTIYNFAEMTRNIGTFTAAGVDLDTSVKAIKGIANLAAGSGSTSAQASTAMYQLSQALAAGRVSLQDWNSVVNAGMGGELFQNALKETAKQMGIVVDESVSFRESLSTAGGKESWLTSDVLINTLEKFADDESLVKAATEVRTLTQLFDTLGESVQSGWAQSWETIIGDSEQAASLFTKLSDNIGGFFNKMSDSRNGVLSGALTSNWDKLVGKINEANISTDDFESKIKEVAKSHGVDVDQMISDYGSLEKAFQSGALSTDILKESVSSLGTSMLDVEGVFQRGAGMGEASDDVRKIQEALQAAGYEMSQFGPDGKYGAETEAAVKAFQEAKGIVADGIVGPETIAALQEATKTTNDLSGSVGDLIDGVTKLSGRDLLIEGLSIAFSNLGKVFGAIHDGWERVFPPESIDERANKLYDLIQSFHDFAESLKPSEATLSKLERTFSGVFAAFDIGVKAITAIGKGFLEVVGYILPFGNGILSATAAVGDFVFGIDQLIGKYDIFNGIVGITVDGIKFFVDIIKGGIGIITSFVGKISEHVSIPWLEDPIDSIEKLIQGFLKLKDGADDAFDSIQSGADTAGNFAIKVFDRLADFTIEVIEAFQNFAKEVRGIVGPIGQEIMDAFSGVSVTDVVGTGLLGGVAILIKRIIDTVQDLMDNAGDLTDSITDVLDSVRGSLEAYQNQLKAGTLLRIAGSVALLAAALVALTYVDVDKLGYGLAAITTLLVEVVGTMELLNRFPVTGIAGAATSMVIMAGAITILASSMSKLKDFQSWDETWPALVSMAGLMAGLTASAKLMSKNVNGMELIKASAGLVIFSIAVGQLAKSMQTFSGLNVGQIIQSLAAIGGLLVEIGLFARFSKVAELSNAKSTIVAIAASMVVMYYAIEQLGSLDFASLAQGFSSVTGLITVLTVALKSMNGLNMKGVASSLIGISAALNLLIVPIELLGRMELSQLAKGLVAVGVSIGAMTASLKILSGNSGGLVSASAGMILMATAMNLLIVPIAALGSLPIAVLATGLGALAIVLIGLGAAGTALAPLGPALITVAGAFTLFGVAAAAIGAGLALLSTGLATLAVSGVAGATALAGALTIIISSVAALLPTIASAVAVSIGTFASTLASQAEVITDALITMILTAASAVATTAPALAETFFILIDDTLAVLEKYAPEISDKIFNILISFLEVLDQRIPELVEVGSRLLSKLVDGILSFMDGYTPENLVTAIAAISALVGVFALLSSVSGMVKGAIKTTAAMLIVVGIIGALFFALGQINSSDSVNNAIALSTLLLSLSASMFIIQGIPIQGALTGIAGLGIVVAGITAICAALGGLAQIPGFSWLISEGTKVLGQIGNAIGSFAGNIIAGFATGVSSSFPQIGQDLSDFMSNAKPFFDGISSIDSSALTGVATLASSILVLTASNIIDGLTSWFTGGNALVKFGQELAEFAPYFKAYYESIKGIDGGVIEASANAATAMAEFANKIPNTGGVSGFFAGENDISTFAEELAEFGPLFKKYADSVVGLDANVVINSANAAMAMAELANNLPNTGGVAGFFAGENDISTFGEQLVPFGESIKKYADSVVGLDANVVINSANAAKALSALAENLPNSGGIVSWFTGDNNIGAFGKDLVTFGECMSDYYNSLTGIDFSTLSYATTQFSKLVDLAGSMSGVDYTGFLNFAQTLGQVGSSGVEEFINAFEDSTITAETAGRNLAKTVVNVIKNYLRDNTNSVENQAKSMIRGMTNTMGNTFESQTPSVQSSMRSLLDGVMRSAESHLRSSTRIFSDGGKNLMNSMANGVNASRGSVVSAFAFACQSAYIQANAYSGSFYSVGANMMFGLARGIRNNQSSAINAASSAAANALAAAKRRLDINSPSKKFEWVGEMSVRGLAGGFDKYGHLVETSAINAADVAVLGMQAVLSRLNTIVSEGMNVQPVITPVMDLSNIYAGVGTANSLLNNQNGTYFGGLYTGTIGRNIQAIRTGYTPGATTVNTNNNKDVVQAINTLNERLDNMARSIENMKVVTETGALVGHIEGKMDQRLGIRQKYKERNI